MTEPTERVVNVTYDAPPTVARFMEDNTMVRGIMGPVGSGKSSGCIMECVRRAIATPPGLDGVRRSRGAIIRNTYPELRDTTIKTFNEWVPSPHLGEWHHSTMTFTLRFEDEHGPVECELLFRALDRPDDVAKLKSLELTFAYLNECSEIDRAVFKLLLTRIGRYPAAKSLPEGVTAWSGIWFDTNPPDNDHWLYRTFEEDRPEQHVLYKQPSGLSPEAENLRFLKPGYYQDIASANAHDPEFVKVFVHGEYGFPLDGKPVYPEYKDNLHIDERIVARPEWPVYLGMDFGLTPAAVLAQRDPRDGQIQVFDEFVSENMGAFTFGGELRRKLAAEYPGRSVSGWGDPAGDQRAPTDERTPFDILLGLGLPLAPAYTNDPVLRREAVGTSFLRMTMLGRPALVAHPRCRTLRKAHQGGYRYKRVQVSGTERYQDKPEKNRFSHVADAEQYLLIGLGEGRLPLTGGAPPRKVRITVRRATGE